MFLKNPPSLSYDPGGPFDLWFSLWLDCHGRGDKPVWGAMHTWGQPGSELERQEIWETVISQAAAYEELHSRGSDLPGWIYDGEYICIG